LVYDLKKAGWINRLTKSFFLQFHIWVEFRWLTG